MLPMDEDTTRTVITFLACAPNGVQTMSAEIEGLVQTSLNLGILKTEETCVCAAFCLRSSVDTQKTMMVDRLRCLTKILGGRTEVWGDYPGWAYRSDSPLRQLLAQVYQEQYGAQPKVEAIHAGLECGLFAGKLEGLDCVSVGPNLIAIHTAQERMEIASVQRLWTMITEVLRRMK